MRYLKLLRRFVAVALQNALAHRVAFWTALLHSLLNLGTGVLGAVVLFGQVTEVRGWGLESTLALLGVYLTLGALRRLFIGPSLESLAGTDGEIWTGQFDFTLLRPVDVQFLVSTRHWQPLALIDLLLGLGVLVAAAVRLGVAMTAARLVAFLLALTVGLTILYATLLVFAALVFWTPVLFTCLFGTLFQMARYPLGMYPGWLRLILTWVIPVGVITTIPAQALTGDLAPGTLVASAILALTGASVVFRLGLRRYASASS